MMINGVEILNQGNIYNTNWQTILMFICLLFGSIIGVFCGIEKNKDSIFCVNIIILGLTICSSPIIFNLLDSTIFNHPVKTQYTIEIKDDNAWKEIGPNYSVIKKIYDTKEIYLIEGDYVND